MIYELEIARALAEDWTVVLEKALLEAEAMNDEKSLSATLLNPEFTVRMYYIFFTSLLFYRILFQILISLLCGLYLNRVTYH